MPKKSILREVKKLERHERKAAPHKGRSEALKAVKSIKQQVKK